MIVCLCKGVSSRTILDEARRGSRTVGQIARSCQAGTCCGACVGQIRELLERSAASRAEREAGSSGCGS